MTLAAKSVTFGYRKDCPVLSGVSIAVQPGEIVGLAGESGCGKTTLVRVLAGLVQPWAGRVERPARRGAVAVVFQSPRTATNPRFTLAQVIAEPGVVARRTLEIHDLAASVGLSHDLLQRRPHEVSAGQLQRACVARVLAQRPDYVLLDEPTSMLDAPSTARIVRVLTRYARSQPAGVVLISHDVDLLAACCDRTVDLEIAQQR